MNSAPQRTVRRARPLLGTLVEVGVRGAADEAALAGCDAAFAAIAEVQRQLSRFDAGSDIARFNALPAGAWLDVQADTALVLRAARQLFDRSGGVFDVSLGSGGWRLYRRQLHKLHDAARIDLGGIGKGHAVDRAVQALRASGAAGGWVNAGGDLRSFGTAAVALRLRDEWRGGVVEFGRLRDGAFATSHFGDGARSQLSTPSASTHAHVSVAAPSCLLADALTKVVAATADASHPLLARSGARAWLH